MVVGGKRQAAPLNLELFCKASPSAPNDCLHVPPGSRFQPYGRDVTAVVDLAAVGQNLHDHVSLALVNAGEHNEPF